MEKYNFWFYEVNIKTFKEFISDFQVFEFGEIGVMLEKELNKEGWGSCFKPVISRLQELASSNL